MVRRLTVLVLAVSTAMSGGIASAGGPSPFIDVDENVWGAAAVTGFTAWSQDASRRHPTINEVVLRADGTDPVRVSAPRTSALLGELDLGGTLGDVLVFTEGSDRGDGNWDVRAIDVHTLVDVALPASVNTVRGEYYPAVSGNSLVFNRGPNGEEFGKKVFLTDLTTGISTVIAQAPRGGSITADDVAGDYVVYSRCPSSGRCHVFRYQISLDTTIRMPVAGRSRAEYFASVLDDGTTYFVQGSARYCGDRTRLARWDGSLTRIASFPDGIEVGPTNAVEVGATALLFTRIRCRGFHTSVWQTPG